MKLEDKREKRRETRVKHQEQRIKNREELHKSYVFYVPMCSIFGNKRRKTKEARRWKFEEGGLNSKEYREEKKVTRTENRE